MNIELMKMICDECGCRENEYDEVIGEKVCQDCGLVLVTEMFEETVHILSKTGELKHSSDKGHLGSVISGKGSYKFNKFGKNSVMPRNVQNGLMHCNMVLASVAPQLELQPRVEKLYLDLLSKGVFGRSQYEARASAIVFYALKENGTPYSFKEVCAEFEPNQKVVKRLVRKINQIHRNSINYTPTNPQFVLTNLLTKIIDDVEFRSQCIKVLEHFEAIVQGSTFNKGRSYYTCIIWITSNIYVRNDITKDMLSKKTGYSRWVIWRQTKLILNLIGLESVKEVKGKELSKIGE